MERTRNDICNLLTEKYEKQSELILQYNKLFTFCRKFRNIDLKGQTPMPNCSYDKMINLLHMFFKQLDNSLYNEFLQIIYSRNCRIFDHKLLEKNNNEILKDLDDFNYFSNPSLVTFDDDYRIYLPITGKIDDICIFIHEIIHKITNKKNKTKYDSYISDVLPYIYELLVCDYLEEEYKITTDYINNRLTYIKSKTNTTILYIDIKREFGSINKDSILAYMQRHNVNPIETFLNIKELYTMVENELEIELFYTTRQIIAAATLMCFYDEYKNNKINAVKKVIEITKTMNKINLDEKGFYSILKELGLKESIDEILSTSLFNHKTLVKSVI